MSASLHTAQLRQGMELIGELWHGLPGCGEGAVCDRRENGTTQVFDHPARPGVVLQAGVGSTLDSPLAMGALRSAHWSVPGQPALSFRVTVYKGHFSGDSSARLFVMTDCTHHVDVLWVDMICPTITSGWKRTMQRDNGPYRKTECRCMTDDCPTTTEMWRWFLALKTEEPGLFEL